MKSFLVKRWFLLLLAVGITLALVFTDAVRSVVEPIPGRAVELKQVLVATTLFLMSWGLESRQLWSSLIQPLPALWATGISYGLLPLLGWLASSWFPPDYQIGILIITSVPCTLASAAIWTRLAGGNEAIALLVTMVTTCTSWLITTGWLTWTTGAHVVALNAASMMRQLMLFLVVPVLAGQLARWPSPLRAVAVRGKITLSVISRLLIFIIIMQAVVDAAANLARNSLRSQAIALIAVAFVCLALHLTALATGFWSSRALRLDRSSRIAVAFAGSQKTLPVGLLLVKNQAFSGHALAVVPVLFYHVGQLLVDTFIADMWARGQVCAEKEDVHA